MQHRQRHLGSTDEKEFAIINVVHLSPVGGKEASFFHRRFTNEHWRNHGRETLRDQFREDPLHNREFQEHRVAHQI